MFIIKCKTCGNETEVDKTDENKEAVYITDFTSSPYSTRMYSFYCEKCNSKLEVHCR